MKRYAFCIFYTCLTCLGTSLVAADRPRNYVGPPGVGDTTFLANIDVPKFLEKMANPLPLWVQEHIQRELVLFQKQKISQRALRATYEHAASCGEPVSQYFYRYRIIGERIYRYARREQETDGILRTLALLADQPNVPDLPSVDFIVNMMEGMPIPWDKPDFWITREEEQAPVFSAWKKQGTPYVVTIPQRASMAYWKGITNQILGGRTRYPWEGKFKTAFWRGNVGDIWVPFYKELDGQALVEHYAQCPRYLLCYLGSLYPDLIDGKFTIHGVPSQPLLTFLHPYESSFVSMAEHLRFAYLPLLDGYGGMGSGACGYEWRLLSNSVVFKQDSICQTWFESALKPYVHYIPIHQNMDNLIEQILWARNHDDSCRQIAETAHRFIMENVTLEDMYVYMFKLLQEYAKLQTFNAEEMLRDTEQDQNWVRIR